MLCKLLQMFNTFELITLQIAMVLGLMVVELQRTNMVHYITCL